MLNIVYLGAPEFSAQLLEQLVTAKALPGRIIQVICPPDKPVGRKKQLTASPVKETAIQYNIPVSHHLQDLDSSADLAILFAFGRIIPQKTLSRPTFGFWNIHPSLLPHYRGASPTIYPLLMGDQLTGTTLMQMDDKLDHGDIIEQVDYLIQPSDTRVDLEQKLTLQALPLIQKNLSRLQSESKVVCQPQVHNDATYTRTVSRWDGYLPLSTIIKSFTDESILFKALPSVIQEFYHKHASLITVPVRFSSKDIVMRMFRGFYGWPGIWTSVTIQDTERRLKILEVDQTDKGVTIETVQLEGKNPVSFQSLVHAYPELAKILG